MLIMTERMNNYSNGETGIPNTMKVAESGKRKIRKQIGDLYLIKF